MNYCRRRDGIPLHNISTVCTQYEGVYTTQPLYTLTYLLYVCVSYIMITEPRQHRENFETVSGGLKEGRYEGREGVRTCRTRINVRAGRRL